MEETDRFFVCEFCRVRLYITSDGPFQYRLVPKNQKDNLIHIPYWRFKGTAFSVQGAQIHHRIIDTTRIAVPMDKLPFSMGARPQTQHLRFAAGDLSGKFIRQTIALPEVLAGMEHQLKELGVDVISQDSIEKAYVGDTVSIIYAPYTLAGNFWVDAIVEKYKYAMDFSAAEEFTSEQKTGYGWSPKFLPAMCPDCGWDLEGERDSCVFVCKNCTTAWESSAKGLNKVAVGALLSPDDNVTYLPFWKIRPKITGADLSSYADLVGFANLPKVIRPQFKSMPLFLWAPAFKIHPSVFLRLGGMFTISFSADIAYENLKMDSVYPVTLHRSEAAESLKIILTSLVVSKRKNYALLHDIQIAAQESELIFLPFVSEGNELIYKKQNIAIQKPALTYGRNF